MSEKKKNDPNALTDEELAEMQGAGGGGANIAGRVQPGRTPLNPEDLEQLDGGGSGGANIAGRVQPGRMPMNPDDLEQVQGGVATDPAQSNPGFDRPGTGHDDNITDPGERKD